MFIKINDVLSSPFELVKREKNIVYTYNEILKLITIFLLMDDTNHLKTTNE